MNLADYLTQEQKRIEIEIDRLCPSDNARPATIHRAMRYSLLAGGKRIRPILFMEAARVVGDDVEGVDTCGLRSRNDPHLLAHSRRSSRAR